MNIIKTTLTLYLLAVIHGAMADEWIAPDTYLNTDPNELAALGFRPNQTVVRRTGVSAQTTQLDTKNIFGTADTNYTAVDGLDFTGLIDNNQKSVTSSINVTTGFSSDALFCSGSGGNPDFQRQIHLPHGSRVLGFEWIGYDSWSLSNIQLNLVEQCIPNDPANEISTTLISDSTGPSGETPGTFARSATGTGTVNNRLCVYNLQLIFERCDSTRVSFNKVVVA